MNLSLSPLADGGLELSPALVREEPRVYIGLLDPSVSRTQDVLTICNWCKRYPFSRKRMG